MPMYQLCVARLDEAAEAHGDHSGYAIAKRSGLAESTVSRLRRGLARPAMSTVMALSKAYDVAPDQLLNEEATPCG